MVLTAMRTATQNSIEKDSNMRKAIQFQVLRHSRYYLLSRGFKGFALWPRLKHGREASSNNLVRAFKLRWYFKTL